MTKKKSSRQKRQKDATDTSEAENEISVPFQGKLCPHVNRAVNLGRVKRTLKIGSIFTCNGCADPSPEDETPEVWLCLQCGYCGCGRMSPQKHGLQHFKTIHSDCHSLVLSTSSSVVWCYDCDDEVQLQSSKNLKQSVDFILKMKVNNNNNVEVAKNEKKSSNQPSLLETVPKEENNCKKVSNDVLKISETKTENKNKKKLSSCQNFSKRSQEFREYMLFQCSNADESCSVDYKWDIPKLIIVNDTVVEEPKAEPLSITLPKEFLFVHTFYVFLKKMISNPQKSETINPEDLFKLLQKKAPQFQSYAQQDSHELLRSFLEGIKQDEIKRHRKAILRHFNVMENSEDLDDCTKKLIKAYGCYASHTIIDKLFGGLLISTILCEECKSSSQIFEPFMDMSLPLFAEKQQENCNQPCALLDGGKQANIKAMRARKQDQDVNDDYVPNKGKKDFSKHSRHQEKKLKQMEKKEKKKLRKAQNKKIVTELKEISPEVDEVNSCKGAADNEEEIDVVNVDENEKLSESNDVDVETIDVDQDACNLNGFENLPNGDIISDSDEDSVKDKSPKEFKQVNHAIDNETGESISVCTKSSPVKAEDTSDSKKSLSSVKTVDDDYFVLFDDTICFDDETPVLSEDENHQVSPSGDATINHTAEVVSECAIKIDVIGDDPVEAGAFGKTDTISEANPPGLEERMQVLSMQVKEIRIRRDSDRQNSILSSSSSSTDDGESTKTTFESDESPEEKIRNQQEEDLSHNLTESQTKEWILKSLTTLQPRRCIAPLECSIDSCISNFTKPELLVGNNKYRCNNCTEMKRKKSGDKTAVAYSNASKQLLVFSPPAVLTLHLKRFQQVGMDLKKVNRFVEFPLILDLAPYCSSACLILPHMAQVKDEILYSLYGIVSHSGALSCGHYVAYVKVSKRTLNETFINKLPLAQCDLEQLLQKYHKLNTSMKSNGEKTESEGEKRWYYISDHAVKEVSEAVVLKCQAYLLFYERIK